MFRFWRNLQDIVIPRDQGWKRIHLTSVIHYSLSMSSKNSLFFLSSCWLFILHGWLFIIHGCVIHYSGFSKPQNSLFIFCLILLFIIHYLASTPDTFRTKSITSCPHKRWRFKRSCLMHSKWGNFSGSGACFSKVPKLFGRISGDTILFVSSEQRRLEERNFFFYSLYNIWKDQLYRMSRSYYYECFSGPKSSRDFRETGPWSV